ncbi:MAG: phospholipid/cholesterol/gamma-HCH transport system substrate-binding protein [Planctomycetota bacterium]|jgi:phospholipid/cholesterol/gamma-HCH transport system substrate-binding protein
MNKSSHFSLGLLFLGALGILAYFTIAKSDFTLFGDSQAIVVRFPQADGLREGNAVLVAGVRWGKVTTITYDPNQVNLDERIEVLISLDEPVELREGHKIMIEDATLLGGKRLTIDPGPAGGAVIPIDTIFAGSVQLNVVEAAGELITGNSEGITEAIDGFRDLVKGVQAGEGTAGKFFSNEEFAEDVDRAVTGFAETGENFATISKRLEQGEGALGKLLTSDEMYTSLKKVTADLQVLLDSANATITDIRAGRGTIGALVTDDALKTDLTEGVRNLREIIERANRGEGTIGKLLVEDTIAVDIQTVVDRLAKGEGTLGRLFAEDQIYNDIERITADLVDVVATVREGRGTVGKLIMEEQLYYEILKAVSLLTRSLEEYREAAPISSITSVILGAF